ncbi:MAG TPA: hypothetical protein VNY51_07445 [Candidatus Dormibacteraeota bacterium]|jgi:hypothetical protein|nr:hypothetical protein [Candidatus Dormibacteraeota bacterium]
MAFVEHALFLGFQWAEPLRAGAELQVEPVGTELHITGLLPRYKGKDRPTDLIQQYEIAAKYRAVGKQRTTGDSPETLFANADTDDKLVAFVRRFGPVVAKQAYTNFERPEKGLSESHLPLRLFAVQDLPELRNEHVIFRSAMDLMTRLTESRFDLRSAQRLIGEIAARIIDWPKQWERERAQSRKEPFWNLRADSRQRIRGLTVGGPDCLLPPALDGRIVLCELVNSFRSTAFPNPPEMHASIKYGVRPLLYAILRRQFLSPRDIAACANTQCRNFFNVERAGQQYCCPACSIHQRQRTYWSERGKKLRKKRLREQKKAKK